MKLGGSIAGPCATPAQWEEALKASRFASVTCPVDHTAPEDTAREYGKTETFFDTSCELFHGLKEQSVTWMSHGDYMAKVPEGFRLCAHSEACPTVGICDEARKIYGVQFHPEVNHTEQGALMLRNFLYRVCKAAGDWTMADYRN